MITSSIEQLIVVSVSGFGLGYILGMYILNLIYQKIIFEDIKEKDQE